MSEKIFKKVGRRYKEIGTEFVGFPSDGIWYVKDGSQNCIIKLHEIGQTSVDALPYVELVPEFFDQFEMRAISFNDFAYELAKFFAGKAEKNAENIDWEDAPF